MALAADRDTKRRDGVQYDFPVVASMKIFAGALVAMIKSSTGVGYVTKGAAATNLTALGIAEEYVDNSAGADGALRVKVRRGVFRFKNSTSSDAIALKDIGASCYIVDDEQVALTNGSSTRSIAGVIRDVDSAGVWVEI